MMESSADQEMVFIKNELLEKRDFKVVQTVPKAAGSVRVIQILPDGPYHAIKTMTGTFAAGTEAEEIKQFEGDIKQEFALMKALDDSPYIVKVHKCVVPPLNEDAEMFGYILMEYAGLPLLTKIKKGYYSNDDIDKWLMQALEGFAFAEKKRIFHGDISLENIAISEEGNVKILDFGCSLQMEEGNYKKTTTRYAEKAKGFTPLFLPPEAIQKESFSYSKIDVYCFGMTFFYLALRNKGLPNYKKHKQDPVKYGQMMHDLTTCCVPLNDRVKTILKLALEYDYHKRPLFSELFRCAQDPGVVPQLEPSLLNNQVQNGIINVVVIGDSFVGKSSIFQRLSARQVGAASATVGLEIVSRKYKHTNGNHYQIVVHDTAGSEKFLSVTHTYFRMAHCVLYIYDVTNGKSLQGLDTRWIQQARENIHFGEVLELVIANKIDLKYRQVTKAEGELFARTNNLKHIEVSAVEGTGIDTLQAEIQAWSETHVKFDEKIIITQQKNWSCLCRC